MSDFVDELEEIVQDLHRYIQRASRPDVSEPLSALEEAAHEVGKAWSGSWIGYQSRIYYKDLTPPPPGNHFSSEWGFISARMGTRGDWEEWNPDKVKERIHNRAGNPDLVPIEAIAAHGRELAEDSRDKIISILEVRNSHRQDPFLSRLLEDARNAHVVTTGELIDHLKPGQYMSRDTLAMTQGLVTPPHIEVVVRVAALRSSAEICSKLLKIAQRAVSHLERLARQDVREQRVGTNVFIGHGRSAIWRDLKDFIQDRLHLPWDEFNRIPVAGITNIARLSEMLDAAAFAFILMTAEDEQSDGTVRARMNVIHEAGLFQGQLGFTKAIILLEEGCEEFSNIHGLGQIRFPSGNISATFEEIRQVLEREGILES
ncbi:TIR domain-containing protein [Limnochorda pilosa]|uniref:CD-NTase-associated protein 12/Pycsar effector protein TIR domain-containing protein n=1 Tax=Limnochorda pilosa TaxID=1555112 RepID=A0A0K2SQW1_LIMPI|nr:TIR domain-containing protein [Limnochorda pilosa]BAS29189.1 hypothetical protein LIP_3377 [Limnochorda pilosa]